MNGYEGRYQINRFGEILSIRQCYSKRKGFYVKKQYLKLQTNIHKDTNYKYKFVVLQQDRIRTTKYIHNLVAKAFIPNPDNLSFVYHIDNDTTNNNVENLKWCSLYEFREITEKQRESGRIAAKKYRYLGRSKIPIEQYSLDGKFIKCYDSLTEASKQTGVNIGHLSQVLSGSRKTIGGYRWKYTDKNNLEKSQ